MFTERYKVFPSRTESDKTDFSLQKNFLKMFFWRRSMQFSRPCWNFSRKGWSFFVQNLRILKSTKHQNLNTLFKVIFWRCKVQFWRACRTVSQKTRQFSVVVSKMIWRKLSKRKMYFLKESSEPAKSSFECLPKNIHKKAFKFNTHRQKFNWIFFQYFAIHQKVSLHT